MPGGVKGLLDQLPLRLDLVGIKAKRAPPIVLRQRQKTRITHERFVALHAGAKLGRHRSMPTILHKSVGACFQGPPDDTVASAERGRRRPSPPPDGCGSQCSVLR
jgi:hypothetical protein